MTLYIDPVVVGVLIGFVGGALTVLLAILVLGAYGRGTAQHLISPAVKQGVQHAYRSVGYAAIGVVAANAGNWLADLLVHVSVPPEVATAVGLVVTGAVSGTHQTMEAQATIRKQAALQEGNEPHA